MAITYLNDFDLTDHEIANLILKDVKLSEAPAVPEPYDIYRLPDGTPYYVTAAGVANPFHDNSIQVVDTPDGSPLKATTNGRVVQLDIAEATGIAPGIISAADKAKLDASIPISQVLAPLGISGNDDGTQTLTIALADATNPGTLSVEHFALLDGATSQDVPNSLILRGDPSSEGGSQTFLGSAVASSLSVTSSISASDISATSITVGAVNTEDVNSAATVGFVKNVVQGSVRDALAGMDRKAQGVRAAVGTDTPLTSTFGTFDEVAIASTDTNKSILLYNQTNPAENGAYDVTAGGLVRRADSNSAANLTTGASYQVEDGTSANHIFTLVTRDGFVLGTDALTFLDISGVNVLVSGNGISIINQQINAKTTVDRTVINADGNIDIAPAYDTAVDNKIAAAIANKKYVAVIGDGVATSFLLPHNLGEDIDVTIWENTLPGDKVYTDISRETANSIRVTFGAAPAPQSYKVVVKA